jgi:predicted Zn-dependent protease with MMP-like domain
MTDEQFDAALDKAMSLLDEDRLKDARKAADQLSASPMRKAETLLLSATVALAEEDFDRAEREASQAIELDPTLFAAYRLCIELASSSGDAKKARTLLDRALDEVEEEEDFIDALLLKAELELEAEGPEKAGEVLAELPPAEIEDPDLAVRAGNLLLELERATDAERYFKMAVASDPESADAYYGLAFCAELGGREDDRVKHFLKVRKLDLAAPRSQYEITLDRLSQIADEEMGALPDRARQLIGNVPILIEDYPSEALVKDGVDPRVLGLFVGPSLTEQTMGGPPALNTIHLFHRNLEMEADSDDAVAEEVRITLLHELGHFFGLEEDDLAEMGLD